MIDATDIFTNNKYKLNYKNSGDGLDLLSCIRDSSINTAFFDPQYRGVLDKLNYGNEGLSRNKARCALPQMDEDMIVEFIDEIDRVLVDSGHLFLWVDKFHLCTGVLGWFRGTNLNLVDMVVWDKGKIGMGYRTRRRSEYCLVFQKSPVRVKGCWSLHNIPDVWVEPTKKTHPHSKPIELQKRLIETTTSPGDIVLDPASGGFSVLAACAASDRNFIGCDLTWKE